MNYLNRLIEDFIKKHTGTDKNLLDEISFYMQAAYCLGMDSDGGIIRYVEGDPESEIKFKTIKQTRLYTRVAEHKIYDSIKHGTIINGYKFKKA